MPLNIRSLLASFLLIFTISILGSAQTSGDVMRERVAKAKAFIAVRNYNAAIYELENIRRETSDPTVNSVTNVLMMNSFLEQGDYKRAQDFLGELSKSIKPNASENYFAVAGQVVKGAKNQMERYRALGLSVSDRNLPKDAVNDVDKMRETLEKVVEQTKVLSKNKAQTSNAMALMEEATSVRGTLARDNFDASRWKNETADAREDLANSRSIVINAVSETPTENTLPNTIADNLNSNSTISNPPKANQTAPTFQPVPTSAEKIETARAEPTNKAIVAERLPEEIKKPTETINAGSSDDSIQPSRTRRVETPKTETVAAKAETKTEPPVVSETDEPKNQSPIAVGSLIGYATQKSNPVYPTMAKSMRLTGVVKIDLIIDENGKVAEVQNLSGPTMLQRAATDAVKKWKFKPFMRDGQATKATGFVSFNFSL
ncbi:MAG: TonB family protein [Pyrinomonadaceae bacterium]|nr:TonB family protein [Pyrinomonadaceae bacterium]